MQSFSPNADRIGPGKGQSQPFNDLIRRLQQELEGAGIPFADMRRDGALELQFVNMPETSPRAGAAAPVAIQRIEGDAIIHRTVAPAAPGSSRLRYFLDGTQRTVRVWRIGVVPIVATIAAAAVLTRDAAGQPSIAPGKLQLKHAWLIPRGSPDRNVQALLDQLDARGAEVVDPLGEPDRVPDYDRLVGDYGQLLEHTYRAARRVRDELEQKILADWQSDLQRGADDGWLVVDGRLKADVPHALGLVKDLTTQHLSGEEAIRLYGLPAGYRTTAFRYQSRHGGADPDRATARTCWYLRLWDGAGYDARHALVRVEAAHEVSTPEEIDRLSAWLLAERIPRATADARWATLLYPIHYLEQILKRRLAGETVGWAR